MPTTSTPTQTSGESSQAVSLEDIQQDRVYNTVVHTINNWAQYCKTQRGRQEREWYMNLAFFFGKQNVAWYSTPASTSGYMLRSPKAMPWRVRVVRNKIRPIIRKEIAKLTANQPSATVSPNTSDEADVMAARAAEQIYEGLYDRLEIEKTVADAVFWQAICGNGFLKLYWDPGATDPTAQMQPMMGPDGTPIMLPSGDLKLEAISPFHILVPDLDCTSIDAQPYVLHLSTRSPEFVKMHYRNVLNGKEVDADTAGTNNILDDAFMDLINARPVPIKQVLVIEAWVKPGQLPILPEGGVVTVAGNQVVQVVPGWPYRHGQFPFAKLDSIPSGKFYNDSTVTDLISPQREYNRTLSQLVENKNLTSRPKYAYTIGSIDPQKINSDPGQSIGVAAGFDPPTPLPPPQVPAYVNDIIQMTMQDMQDIASQHDVTNGNAPSGVTAGTAINYLQEQDDTVLSAAVLSIERMHARVGRQLLNLVGQFWNIPRMVKYIGADSAFDAQEFVGQNINGNTDLKIEPGSGMPVSKAAKQATIMQLMQLGLVMPQDGLPAMEMGGLATLYEQVDIDKRQARRENMKMAQLDPMAVMQLEAQQGIGPNSIPDPSAGMAGAVAPAVVPVNDWDNHQIHIVVHNNYRKSEAFDTLDPVIQAEFDRHVKMHMAMLQEQQISQMQMAAAAEPLAAAGPGGELSGNAPPTMAPGGPNG